MSVTTVLGIVVFIMLALVGTALLISFTVSRGPRRLAASERNRLELAETTIEKIYLAACDERELGQASFADIVIGEVREYRTKNQQLRQLGR